MQSALDTGTVAYCKQTTFSRNSRDNVFCGMGARAVLEGCVVQVGPTVKQYWSWAKRKASISIHTVKCNLPSVLLLSFKLFPSLLL